MGRKNRLVKHASVFSGIGGFDLAAEWIGWDNVFHCEINDFCRKLLKHYFPRAESYGDIKKTDFSKYRGRIDVLTGGFPCQPFSVAGKRLGKDDERHLWPDMLRAIREIQPQWVVGENVLGITSWNAGVVFEEVQSDLEAEGYEVQPYVIPAAGVGAPHRRDRVWFIAYRIGMGLQKAEARQQAEGIGQPRVLDGPVTDAHCFGGNDRDNAEADPGWGKAGEPFSERDKVWHQHTPAGRAGATADPDSLGCDDGGDHRKKRHVPGDFRPTTESEQEWQERERGAGKASQAASVYGETARPKPEYPPNNAATETAHDIWENWPVESPVCNGDDGLSGLLDGITFPKWRVESIKAGGNAIVPQIAYRLFLAIQSTNDKLKRKIA